jgi:pimeloyl-ACP methyl ester carboxylesterase
MIVSHGFMCTGRTVKKEAQRFAGLGFAAVACDFIGGGVGSKSEGRSTEMSVLTEVEDLLAIIQAARELPYADENDLSLCGCSQGGFVSALAAAKLQEQIRRLILFYPALCIPDDARKGRMMFAKFDPANVPERLRCGPMMLGRRYVTDVIDMEPYAEISGYAGPVLLLHGTADKIVAPAYSARAFERYLAERGVTPGADCQLVMIDGGNHGLSGLFSRKWMDYAFFAIEKFLEGKAPILNVDVKLTTRESEKLERGRRRKLFFEGKADSPFFKGEVEPGAYDEQICCGRVPDSCHAAYTVKGTDYSGHPCSVSIVNDMPSGGKKNWARGWIPTVSSDSPRLDFLARQQCETYAEMRRSGPFIHIFADPRR